MDILERLFNLSIWGFMALVIGFGVVFGFILGYILIGDPADFRIEMTDGATITFHGYCQLAEGSRATMLECRNKTDSLFIPLYSVRTWQKVKSP